MKRIALLSLSIAILLGSALVPVIAGDAPVSQDDRPKAAKLMKDGNWKEAYDILSKLAIDKADDPKLVGQDLNNAVNCLRRLNRVSETDAFREKVIAAHKGNWRLLQTAAESYLNVQHYGAIVAGEFKRGPHRGGTAKMVNSYERDRIRALQLMQQALPLVAEEDDKPAASQFYMALANQLMGNRGWSLAWRLQYLSDLTELPDYDEGYYGGWYYRGRGQSRGAPVDEKGKPVYHKLPRSWESAKTDGERWRWALLMVQEAQASRTNEVRWHFAQFLHNQFGVQTMAQYGMMLGRGGDDSDTEKDESGTYALHTLGEGETIARLATGIKRFKLPDEFNYLKIIRELVATKGYGEQPSSTLAQIFENRRQYPTAADVWRQAIKDYGNGGSQEFRGRRLNQIIGNWGQFEPVMTAPSGKGATVDFRFRNGAKVDFVAHEIDVPKLLADVKDYIKSKPKQLDWHRMNIGNIGYQLVIKDQKQYVGEKVASWGMDLEPRANHFDRRVTVTTPLQKAGAYLVVAKMAGGNVSRIILWVADTAIVQKNLDKQAYFFVADAVGGKPIAKANLEFFGYQRKYVRDDAKRGQGHYEINTRNFAEFTDVDGQLILKPDQIDRSWSWLITATTPSGRLAYLGFTGIWFSNYYDAAYNQVKTYIITDRPVYRPAQPVKFKFWVNRAQYDQEEKSEFAGQTFIVRINNPKGEKVVEKQFKADEFGGFDGEWELPKEATLGVYRVYLHGNPGGSVGGGTFRVEEYKKPEFEVKVDAPTEPVMLGEKITATINTKYYFGAPVTNAKVKYKVTRVSHSAEWYPTCRWDWYYGPGYWWYAYDYLWYPGWGEWGCRRPMPWGWWQWHPRQQPEIVAEAEVEVGPDGTVKVDIDTGLAKAVHGHTDHKYEITAEVTDKSRRTIVGTGSVLVARKPFKVYTWVNRGHYRVGDTVTASFKAQTLDRKPVQGKGVARLLKITYKDNKPVEVEVQKWKLDTDAQGEGSLQMKASQAGQYRLSYKVTDSKKHTIEGAYVFVVRGEGFDGSQFRFNDIELVTDKREYAPGDKVKLMVNTDRAGAAVVLFIRPANGVYLPPKVIRLKGKSVMEEIEIIKKDMPNFFVEGMTVHGANVYSDVREVIVPPAKRVLNVEVKPSAEKYKPGAKAKMTVKVTDHTGEPYVGSLVVAMYDKSVEYISGGSNVPDIKEFFWKWRRNHRSSGQSSLSKGGRNITKPGEVGMGYLGVFGASVADEMDSQGIDTLTQSGSGSTWGDRVVARQSMYSPMTNSLSAGMFAADGAAMPSATAAPMGRMMAKGAVDESADADGGGGGGQPAMAQPTVRTNFADTALWVGEITTKVDGLGEFELTMPENLTTWKTRVWAMGAGTRVGEGSAETVTTKDLLVRLQAPRFFVQKDEVVLSANVHNYLKTKKTVKVVLEIDELGGAATTSLDAKIERQAAESRGSRLPGWELAKTVEIDADSEKRVDWRIRVDQPGEIAIRMKALTDEESDAMEMKFPVFIHGMLKTESFCGVIRPDANTATVAIRVPAERLPAQSRLELRYSPTLAMAMIDALPYMVDYPHGCTEQTLNRFLPTVITQKILLDMNVNLEDIRKKRTNLNAQEIGDDVKRAKQWGGVVKPKKNPVYDEETVRDMVKAGIERLLSMRCSDGGWGWFSGWGERSYPHTTAVVVHGLQIARANDVAIVPGTIEGGIKWLKNYQATEVQELKNASKKKKPWKDRADALDAFVYMVLVDEKLDNKEMREFLYRDRNGLPVYAKSMFGMALHKVGDVKKRDMIIRNIEQFLVQDEENQTAWLNLTGGHWWYWYGSEYEAQAYYLKLLAAVQPKSEKASRLVKYLLNNRKHATYWNSTRDTAVVIEAFADYIKAAGEDKPDMTVQILIDGKQVKKVKIDGSNLFSFDNKLVLTGDEVTTGEHKIEVRRTGKGPVYFNAYLTNFTLEDPIEATGLEIKVNRKYYKLVEVDKKVHAAGARGQVVMQKVEKYERQELKNLALLKSGDLVEIELEIDSKNDYEYIMFEDMKAAGFEPVEVRSGYNGNDMGAYMELRDERVCFFVRALARGKHSVSYRMRAEIPGKFSALPTKASAMYAPELKANSDEIKLRIED